MKIAIMNSLDFSNEVISLKKELEKNGHTVSVCYSVSRVINGELTVQQILDLKKSGKFSEYTISKDLIRWNWDRMQNDDAVLVVNLDKKDIKNYIGGNTFLEMGFAHILKKKIFLWNDIPDMLYADEIKAMRPIVLNKNLDLIS